jgi:c(7)-type cytochrome triheme protein
MRAMIVALIIGTAAVAWAAPTVQRAEINVRTTFSHAKHAPRGAACTACHAARPAPDAAEIQAPAATTCQAARCHDGAAAFAITTACRRCHVEPEIPPDAPAFKVARPTARYSHATHAKVTLACAACHPLTRTGEVTVIGHAPCATCHADDFGRRQPTICGACHNGSEPWRALVADRGPPEATEFGASLDHGKHAAPCARCHTLTTAATQLRPPRGHRACTTAGCHAVTGGPAPQLTACEACHRAGAARDRQAARLAAPWSVRATFDHAVHARAIGEPARACETCHTDVRAADVRAIAAPGKPTCAPCHDGRAAFKLTGTACTRCHPGRPR